MGTQEAKKGETTPSKGTLQSYVQNFTKEAINTLVEIMRTSRNEALKMGAAKVILDKSLADLKSTELNGGVNEDGSVRPVFINLGGGFVPANITLQGTSTGSLTTPITAV